MTCRPALVVVYEKAHARFALAKQDIYVINAKVGVQHRHQLAVDVRAYATTRCQRLVVLPTTANLNGGL